MANHVGVAEEREKILRRLINSVLFHCTKLRVHILVLVAVWLAGAEKQNA